ncbi:MAG: exodeoxyribonuclease VII small subunit [Chlamydiota bacterium]
MADTATEQQQQDSLSFEEAYDRIEKILKEISQGEVALEKSLKLYEEADKLILACDRKLTTAEQKIEQLSKNRNGELALDSFGNPMKRALDSKREEILTRDLQAPYDSTSRQN